MFKVRVCRTITPILICLFVIINIYVFVYKQDGRSRKNIHDQLETINFASKIELLVDNSTEADFAKIIAKTLNELPAFPFDFYESKVTVDLEKNQTCAQFPALVAIQFHNNYWQRLQVGNLTLHLYKAYYDNRTLVDKTPMVRITTMINYNNVRNPPSTYCHIWFNERNDPAIIPVMEYQTLWWRKGDAHNLFPHLISCQIPAEYRSFIPQAVTLVTQPCDNGTNVLSVIYNLPAASRRKEGFAVCIKNIFYPHRRVSAARMIEWLELQRILGVSKVNFYKLFVNENVTKVLDHYERESFVENVPITLAQGEAAFWAVEQYLTNRTHINNIIGTESLALTDCFYRNMYMYDYIAVMDIDELIMPLGNLTNWQNIIDLAKQTVRFDRCEKYTSYCFHNIYFPKYSKYIQSFSKKVSSSFYMLQHIRRIQKHSSPHAATKCLHDTNHVISIHKHWPLDCEPAIVNETYAQFQHYREPHNKADLLPSVIDDNIWRFSEKLVERCMNVFHELKFFRKHAKS